MKSVDMLEKIVSLKNLLCITGVPDFAASPPLTFIQKPIEMNIDLEVYPITYLDNCINMRLPGSKWELIFAGELII